MTSTKKSQSTSMTLRVILLVLLILLVVVMLWYLLYYSPLFARLLVLTGLSSDKSISSLRFTGESFALSGDALAVASPIGAQLIGSDGVLLSAESFAMDCPAVSACESLGAFYDVGGTALCILTPEGESILLPQEQRILSADVGRDGYLTLVTESPGYKGRVQVYSPGLSPLFRLDCGSSGYPLCARVSPRKHLAVCCVSSLGSILRFFSLDSEQELGAFSLDDALILDFNFQQDGSVVALTESSLLFLSEDGSVQSQVALDAGYPMDYCLTGDCVALLLGNAYSGSGAVLCTYSSRGELLGSIPVDRSVSSLSVCEGQLLVLYEDEMTLYPADFSDSISYQHISNGKLALLSSSRRALLLGSRGAEIIRFP